MTQGSQGALRTHGGHAVQESQTSPSREQACSAGRHYLVHPEAVCYSNILEKMGQSSANALLPGPQTQEPHGVSPECSPQADVFLVCTWTEEVDPKFARSLDLRGRCGMTSHPEEPKNYTALPQASWLIPDRTQQRSHPGRDPSVSSSHLQLPTHSQIALLPPDQASGKEHMVGLEGPGVPSRPASFWLGDLGMGPCSVLDPRPPHGGGSKI